MDKNKIIEQYWLNDEVNQAFAKMQPEELQYDLKIEVFMVLLEMEDIGFRRNRRVRPSQLSQRFCDGPRRGCASPDRLHPRRRRPQRPAAGGPSRLAAARPRPGPHRPGGGGRAAGPLWRPGADRSRQLRRLDAAGGPARRGGAGGSGRE
jgi:hypothetical protein